MAEPRIFGTHDDATLAQARDVASRAERFALMADGHLGYVMPIGGVAAYDNKISIVGVGVDIACGNCALRTDITADQVDLLAVAAAIQETIAFGPGRTNKANDAPTDDPLFTDPAWDAIPDAFRSDLKAMARAQLGTVGGGNHYVDVFADETNHLWVGVHFGSRGFGFTVAHGCMSLADNEAWGKKVLEREVLIDLDTPLGDAYWSLMSLAGRYAYAGRDWVAYKVVEMLGAHAIDRVHNHHNFAWKETHEGREFVVIRKGATPAFPMQRGFVGGSMGDDAVILRGGVATEYESEMSRLRRQTLFSTVHGAGRVMSRTVAKGKFKKRKRVTDGVVTREMSREWTDKKGVIVRGGDVDEAPQVYRRLPDVLAAQGETVVIEHTLRPLVVVMADARTFDPYKD